MSITLTAEKQRITEWINSLEDEETLHQITLLMNKSKSKKYYSEEEARKISKAKIAEWFGK